MHFAASYSTDQYWGGNSDSKLFFQTHKITRYSSPMQSALFPESNAICLAKIGAAEPKLLSN